MNRRWYFDLLQKKWNQALLRHIRFRQCGFITSIPQSLWHPAVTVSGDHGGGSDVMKDLFLPLNVVRSVSSQAWECGPTRPWNGSQRCEPLSLWFWQSDGLGSAGEQMRSFGWIFWGIFLCKRFGCQLSIRLDPMVWTGPCSECVKLRLICWKVWWWTQWGKKITHFDLYKPVKIVGLTHFGRLSMEAVCSHKCHRRTDSAGMDKNRTCESTVSFPKTIQSLTGLTLMKYYARWWFQTFFLIFTPH